MVDFERQMNLRNRIVQISNIPKKNTIEQASTSKTYNATADKETNDKGKSLEEVVRKENTKENFSKELLQKVPNKEALDKNDPSGDFGKKQLANLKELNLLDIFSSSTSFENEIEKVKISFPFSEILKKYEYRSQIGRMLKFEDSSNTVNLQDDKPTIMFGPRMESSQEGDVPPFYIGLRIHNLFLHNAMLDLGASHNIMPKIIMDNLGLDITRMDVSLHKMPKTSIVMDVVVVDVPVKFGMLRSRSWASKLKGTLQMEMSYATIHVFREQRRLYRENMLAYMISSPK